AEPRRGPETQGLAKRPGPPPPPTPDGRPARRPRFALRAAGRPDETDGWLETRREGTWPPDAPGDRTDEPPSHSPRPPPPGRLHPDRAAGRHRGPGHPGGPARAGDHRGDRDGQECPGLG